MCIRDRFNILLRSVIRSANSIDRSDNLDVIPLKDLDMEIRKRNWRKFSIRTGLITITLIAAFFAYISSVITSLAPLSRHYDAIFWQHGASVTYEPIEKHRWLHLFLDLTYDTTITSVTLFKPEHDGKTLSALIPHINEFDSFWQLSIQNAAITDDDLSELGNLGNLKQLHLVGTNFSDAGIAHVAELENLETLVISKTRVTVNGLNRLRGALPYCGIIADIPSPPVKTKPEEER